MSSSWAARVAGSATAMLLARLGHDVVVVDQASFPSDTVSTHSIARSGVVQLRRWGLLDEVLDSGAPAIRQVTFNAAGESTTRTIKDKAGVDFLVAPRRYVLDTLLATAAEQAGAEVRTGVTVTGLQRDGHGRVVGVTGHDRTGAPVEIGARCVIGADGLRSRVAGLVDATDQRGRPGGRRRPVRLLRRHPVERHRVLRRRAVLRRRVPDPPRAGLHLGLHARRRRQGGPPRDRVTGGGLRPAARSVRPPSWPSGCGRLAGPHRSRACSASPTSSARRSGRAGPWSGTPATTVTPSPPTASATPSATPSSWPSRLTRRWTATARRPRPWRPTSSSATRRCAEIFEITCRLAAYPPVPTFVELQKQLSAAIDNEAAALAARPVPGERLLATA